MIRERNNRKEKKERQQGRKGRYLLVSGGGTEHNKNRRVLIRQQWSRSLHSYCYYFIPFLIVLQNKKLRNIYQDSKTFK